MGKEPPCEKQGSASSKEKTACAKVPKSEEFDLKKERKVWLMTFVLIKRSDPFWGGAGRCWAYIFKWKQRTRSWLS